MFFKSNFSYSNSSTSYSDLLLEIDSGKIQSIYFFPRKREVDVLYKNGKKEKVPILYNDQLILEKASENNVELTINNSRKESSAANSFASVGLFLIWNSHTNFLYTPINITPQWLSLKFFSIFVLNNAII